MTLLFKCMCKYMSAIEEYNCAIFITLLLYEYKMDHPQIFIDDDSNIGCGNIFQTFSHSLFMDLFIFLDLVFDT